MRLSSKFFWKEYRGLIFFISFMFVFRSAVADWVYVPSSSMNPTLIAGDRVGLNKMAYNLRVPFSFIEIARWADPQAGDVITFDSPADDVNLIKRVVAVGGETVAMVDNTIMVNGIRQQRVLVEPSRTLQTEQGLLLVDVWRERLGYQTHDTALIPSANRFTNFDPIQVPVGHVMVLGDSRDNSNDSRFIGFIDKRRITGRAERVVMSHDPDRLYLPRYTRWWLPLNSGT